MIEPHAHPVHPRTIIPAGDALSDRVKRMNIYGRACRLPGSLVRGTSDGVGECVWRFEVHGVSDIEQANEPTVGNRVGDLF